MVKVVSGFEVAYRETLADERALQSRLDQSKNEIQSINRKNHQLSQLEREYEELLLAGEGVPPTDHVAIRIAAAEKVSVVEYLQRYSALINDPGR